MTLDEERRRNGRRSPDSRALPEVAWQERDLSVLAGAQYALRIEQAQEAGERRVRFGQARHLVTQELATKLHDAGFKDGIADRLHRDNADLLQGRFSPPKAAAVLLAAHLMNPVAPYEIALDGKARDHALTALAADLGFPSTWAETVIRAEDAARAVHDARWSWRRAAVAVAGIAVIAALPALVLAAAPAGLAGGAAIVAGLAALGPGGMLGGLAIVGLLGGAGGAATAHALTAGTAAQVEENVIYLQSLALAKRHLEYDDGSRPEWYALVGMEDAVAETLARSRLVSDDGAPGVKENERKLKSITRALEWMRDQELGPPAIQAGA